MNKIKTILSLSILTIMLTVGLVYASSPEQQAIAFANQMFDKEWRGTCTEVWRSI